MHSQKGSFPFNHANPRQVKTEDSIRIILNNTRVVFIQEATWALRLKLEKSETNVMRHSSDVITTVADRVDAILATLDTSPPDISYLHTLYDGLQPYRIDYDRYRDAFAVGFLKKNFLHAAMLFLQSPFPLPLTIADCGSGSGATTIAYLSALQTRNTNDKPLKVCVDLVDESTAQLELAKNILDFCRDLFPNLEIETRFHYETIAAWIQRPEQFEVILMGHLLTENRELARSIWERLLRKLKPKGRIFLLEDCADPVWNSVQEGLWQLPAPRIAYATSTENVERLRIGLDPHFKNRFTKCVLISRLRSLIAERLLSLYFQAWKEQSISLLESVFTSDARYLDFTWAPGADNLEAIRHYWQQNVLTQSNLQLNILQTFESGFEVACEWSAYFDSPIHGCGVRFDGMLVLTVDERAGKATELREYFHRIS